MTDFEKLFEQGAPNRKKLLQHGFTERGDGFYRESPLSDFVLRVFVTADGKVRPELYDPEADAPYTLHLVPGADGSFVGEVRALYESALKEIAETCFDSAVFKNPLTKEVIAYAGEAFGEDPEFLWERYPEDAVLRRKDNRKWYAALLTVAGNKVGLASDDIVTIADLRADEEEVPELIGRRGFAPAWHMNKKHWFTVLLDGSVDLSEIKELLVKSREIAKRR